MEKTIEEKLFEFGERMRKVIQDEFPDNSQWHLRLWLGDNNSNSNTEVNVFPVGMNICKFIEVEKQPEKHSATS